MIRAVEELRRALGSIPHDLVLRFCSTKISGNGTRLALPHTDFFFNDFIEVKREKRGFS